MSIFYNAATFNTAPTLSGANITAGTIPVASAIGTAVTLGGAQTLTGANVFSQKLIASFSVDPGSTSNLNYGLLAGSSITSGQFNTNWGANAGKNITTGSYNTNIGSNAGLGNAAGATGSNNTNCGYNAGAALTSGSRNTNIGSGAGSALTTGSNNTYVGLNSGSGCTTCSFSSAFGASATPNNFSNSTAIGVSATCTAANQVMLGTSALINYFPGTSTTLGCIQLASSLKVDSAKTTVAGSVGGSIEGAMPEVGSVYKMAVIYCASLNGTATYTFPLAFSGGSTPVVTSTNGLGAAVISVTTSAATITGVGAATTGFIILEGV